MTSWMISLTQDTAVHANLVMLLLATVLLATLHPCGKKASFAVTEDGGTNFAAEVRVARWQADSLIVIDFKSNSVTPRSSSIVGDVALVSAVGASSHTFKLLKLSGAGTRANPPGSFTFRADGLPSQPAISCDLGDELLAFSPSPPPPPPHCGASFIWRNERNDGSRFAAFLDVGGSGVPEGWLIRIAFNQGGMGMLATEGATVRSFESGTLLIRPNLRNERTTISLRLRGKQASPQIACVLEPAAPPPPPSTCALGTQWELTEAVKEGKRYQVQGRTRRGGRAPHGPPPHLNQHLHIYLECRKHHDTNSKHPPHTLHTPSTHPPRTLHTPSTLPPRSLHAPSTHLPPRPPTPSTHLPPRHPLRTWSSSWVRWMIRTTDSPFASAATPPPPAIKSKRWPSSTRLGPTLCTSGT